MKKKKIMLCGVILLSLSLQTACSILPQEEEFERAAVVKEYEGEEFSMTTVKRGDVRNYNRINCVYHDSNTENVELDEWIMISDIKVKVGDKVKAGDLLVVTMSEEADTSVDDIRDEITKKELQISHARKMSELQMARQRIVLDDEVSIRAIQENYEVEIAGYETELADLNSQLDWAIEEQTRYQITAGIDGVVTYVNPNAIGNGVDNGGHRRGGGFGRGTKIVTISDGTLPSFSASKDSSQYISQLSENDMITISTIDSKYEAKVHFPEDDEESVYFMLDYFPEDISDGNRAVAEYVLAESIDVLYLPDSAVNKMGNSYVVYCEDENGLKNAKEVEVGLIADNKAEIKSGLEFGDAVIVR